MRCANVFVCLCSMGEAFPVSLFYIFALHCFFLSFLFRISPRAILFVPAFRVRDTELCIAFDVTDASCYVSHEPIRAAVAPKQE